MKLIILQGAPATGKTSIAQYLVKWLECDYFFKDQYKENQYDLLGRIPSLKEWAGFERKSWQELYKAIKIAQNTDETLIIEANFLKRQKKVVTSLIRAQDDVREIYCFSSGVKSYKRYKARQKDGSRHTGHRDYLWNQIILINSMLALINAGPYRPFNLSKRLLKVDTTDFSKLDHKMILEFVRD